MYTYRNIRRHVLNALDLLDDAAGTPHLLQHPAVLAGGSVVVLQVDNGISIVFQYSFHINDNNLA